MFIQDYIIIILSWALVWLCGEEGVVGVNNQDLSGPGDHMVTPALWYVHHFTHTYNHIIRLATMANYFNKTVLL